MAAVAIKAAVIKKKTCGRLGLPEGICLCICLCANVRPQCKSSSSQDRSWRVVRTEIICRFDKSKRIGHDCESWDLIITTLGLTKMVETAMMSGWRLCGKSRVCFKSRLHCVSSAQKCIYFELENLLLLVVIEFIWIPGDPITASKSIPECFALKANVVAR